ncbi:glutathione S-transferase [Setomelanomma holmii]|uniref:Glutathione S-transferase n=1 Tax=Setomelanomma holmii TaxID=210430 RepID=A0A9P4H6K7_9PLEO|nr:glutathione S-transferase [Setomelanomma holmii]
MTPGSVALASHIALQESGLDFSIEDLKAQRGFRDEHLHLNPKARVPILELDNERITETPAILTTISALAPQKNLLGKTITEQARAQEWMAWLCGTVHGQAFGCLFRSNRFVGDESVYDAIKARGRGWVKECFDYVEGKLEGRTHAIGDAFTVVDAYLYVFYRWGNLMKLGMRFNFPNYTRVVQNVVERNLVKKTIEAESIRVMNE